MTVLVNGEIVLYGFVGDNMWEQGFIDRDVVDALAELGRDTDVTVRLNSGGGYIADGIAIFNALSAHKGKVTVVVDGIAASSASVIAMAGDERIMRSGSLMMIHDPSGMAYGTVDDIAKTIKALDAYRDSIAAIYAETTGEALDALKVDMKAETWISAEDAVTRGFATANDNSAAIEATAYDYRLYAHAPERLVALAATNHWSLKAARSKAMARCEPEQPPMQEQTMTNKPAAGTFTADDVSAAIKAATDRIQKIVTSEEAKGREPLAQHLAYNTALSVDDVLATLKSASVTQPASDPAKDYENERQAAGAGLARPGGKPQAPQALDAKAIYAKRRQANR
ncbi:MAG: hypothetical protein H6R00_181 [Proteobacteria bacterium]|nr:hypothetical protein [Pseudomonadota bacterium]